jgi:ferredoxin/flavodoxin---NADP+ reductase
MSAQLNAEVVRKIDITSELFLLHLRPDGGVPEFTPGQYVAVGMFGSAPRPEGSESDKTPQKTDKIIKRAYSIGSSPVEKDYLEFYIALVQDGTLTPRLSLLAEGERVFVAPKITGTFTLGAIPDAADLLLVSTGTGIAPFMSMLRTPSTWTQGRSITILHGVRYQRDLMYREEIEQMIRDGLPITYHAAVSREADCAGCTAGRVTTLFNSGVLNPVPQQCHVMLCGNPVMIEEVESLLGEKGYEVHTRKNPGGSLHLEKYW